MITSSETLIADIEELRDYAAELQDAAADDKTKRYMEGRRDAYDIVLWRIRGGKQT